MAQYRNINIRSPFYVQLPTTEDSTILEIRIWTGELSAKPTDATYSLVKEQSGGQSTFEIAEIVRDFCNHTSDRTTGLCWVETVLDDGANFPTTTIYLASEGYTLYKDGVNHNGNSFETDFVALPTQAFGTEKRIVTEAIGSWIPIYVQPQNSTGWRHRFYNLSGVAGSWFGFSEQTTSEFMFRYINVTTSTSRVEFDFNGTIENVYVDALDCNKYNAGLSSTNFNDRAVGLMYVNKYGARSRMICSLKHTESISVTDSTFQRNVTDTALLSNGAGLHASRRKITGSKQSFVINTDWLNEYHVTQLEELIMSEYVWVEMYSLGTINYQPVNLKTSKLDKKNHLNDKLIQYTFNIETASEYMNTVR